MNATSIEWATHSWNPVRGCSRVSEGCRNCYARDRNDAINTCDDEPDRWPDGTEVEADPNGYREDYQGAPVRIRLRAKKGGDMAECPRDCRVREWPAVAKETP